MHPNVPQPARTQSLPPDGRGRASVGSPNVRSPRDANGAQPNSRPRPWDPFLIAAAGLLLVGQARTHTFVPGLSALRPALLLIGLGLVLWFVQKERMRSPKRLDSSLVKVACFIPVWATIGVPFALWQGGAARYLIEGLAPTFLAFLIVAASVRDLEDVRRLVGIFALGTALYAIMAPQNPIGRAFGAGGYDPNDSGMFLVSGLPILIFFVLFGRQLWVRIAATIGALLTLFAIIDTGSRGGFLALVAVLACMTLLMKAVKPAIRIGLVGLVVLASIPVASSDYWERMRTIQEFDDGYSEGMDGRRNVWDRAVQYAAQNPLTGVGIDNFTVAEGLHPEIQERIAQGLGTKYSVAHSQWYQVLAELGIPGFISFVSMFLLALKELWRLQGVRRGRAPPNFNSKELRAMAGALMISLIGVMVAGSFLSNAFGMIVWAVVGMVAGLVKVTHYRHIPDPRAHL